MGYLQTSEPGSIHENLGLGPAPKPERAASPAALGRAPQSAPAPAVDKLDRVTLSPAADALAQDRTEVGSASPERLDVLREAIKANTMPIYPRAVAEAILREEGQGSEQGAAVRADSAASAGPKAAGATTANAPDQAPPSLAQPE